MIGLETRVFIKLPRPAHFDPHLLRMVLKSARTHGQENHSHGGQVLRTSSHR